MTVVLNSWYFHLNVLRYDFALNLCQRADKSTNFASILIHAPITPKIFIFIISQMEIKDLGVGSMLRCHLTSTGNPIVEIRLSYNSLISTVWFPILIRWHLYIESGPCLSCELPMSWLLTTLWCKEFRHQQPRYQSSLTEIFQPQPQKDLVTIEK